MDIFAQYATNETREVQGAWVEHGDAKFLIGRAGNSKYIKLFAAEIEKNQQLLDKKDDAADALSEKIMMKVMVETVLLGWENVSFKGKPLTYSKANAELLLGVKDFRRLVTKWSDDINNYKVKEEEAQAKN